MFVNFHRECMRGNDYKAYELYNNLNHIVINLSSFVTSIYILNSKHSSSIAYAKKQLKIIIHINLCVETIFKNV